MAQIRSIDAIAKKWAVVTPGRSEDYRQGVAAPRKDWAAATAAAEPAYEAGVQAAVAKKKFGRGVKASGTEAWSRGATEKGTQRWGPGVALAQDRFATGFQPYREAIERVTLPPRYARRDPRNLERVAAIANALGKAKEARLQG